MTARHGRPITQDRIRYFVRMKRADGSFAAWPKLWSSLDEGRAFMDYVVPDALATAFWAQSGFVEVQFRTTYIGGGIHG